MTNSSFDDILVLLGTSKWNLYVFILYSFMGFMMPAIVLNAAFMVPAIDPSCVPDTNAHSFQVSADNCSYSVFINVSEKVVEEHSTCTQWTFESEYFPQTLTEEFELVCDNSFLRPTYQTVYMLGNFIGAPLTGYFSDKYGRKRTMAAGAVVCLLATVLGSFLNNFNSILLLRFIVGFSHPAIIATGYILCIEVCEPRVRSTVGVILAFPWALGTMWFGYLGYLIRDWRWLQRATLIPGIVFLCGLYFLPESPRWQIVKGKHEEAMKNLKRAARWNNSLLPDENELTKKMTEIQQSSMEQDTLKIDNQSNWLLRNMQNTFSSVFVLFRTPELRKRVLLMYISFAVSSTVFYGLSLNAVNFNLDPFMYTIVSGIIEIPSYSLTIPIIAKFGRVWPTVIAYFICGVTLISIAFLPSAPELVVISLAMTGKLCIAAAYQVIYLISSEIFPTEVRLLALGTANFVSRIGSMVAPYITDSSFATANPWFPTMMFGVLSLIASAGAVFFPESRDAHLYDTINKLETEERQRKANKRIRREKASQEEAKHFET